MTAVGKKLSSPSFDACHRRVVKSGHAARADLLYPGENASAAGGPHGLPIGHAGLKEAQTFGENLGRRRILSRLQKLIERAHL